MQAGGMGYGYQETPDIKRKRMMAQMLMQQAGQPLDANRTASGGLAIPISPFEGLAKVLQGGIAGYANAQADKAEKAGKDDYQKTLGDALMAQQSGVKEWVNPDTGQVAIQGKPAGNQTMIDILRGNESTMPLAMNMQLSQAEAQQKLANDIAKEQRKRELDLQYAPQIEAAKFGATKQDRMDIAAAGRSSTNVNVNNAAQKAESAYSQSISNDAAKQDMALIDAGRAAPKQIDTANRILGLLNDKNKPITGTGAETRAALANALSTVGLIDGDTITNTQDLVSALGKTTLAAIKTSGLGAGQGFTNADREFLAKAEGGTLDFQPETLKRLATLTKKAAQLNIKAANSTIENMRKNPDLGTVANRFEPIEDPSPPDNSAIEQELRRRGLLK